MVSSSAHPYEMSFYSLETADVGGGGQKSDMIKVNVCCVR